MTSSKPKVLALFAGVFLLGSVAGAAVHSVVVSRHELDLFDGARRGSRHGVFLWSLERKLDLRADQKDQIRAVLARYDHDLAEIPPDPRTTALRTQMRSDLRATLDPGQQAKFDELIASWDAAKARPASSAK